VAYCIFVALLYLALLAMMPFLIAQESAQAPPGADATPVIVITAVIVIPFFLIFALAPFLPKKPWAWIYHLVLICLGMSGCTIVASIPLLIFWLKPETKAFFGRS
jgi:hypothetical protein